MKPYSDSITTERASSKEGSRTTRLHWARLAVPFSALSGMAGFWGQRSPRGDRSFPWPRPRRRSAAAFWQKSSRERIGWRVLPTVSVWLALVAVLTLPPATSPVAVALASERADLILTSSRPRTAPPAAPVAEPVPTAAADDPPSPDPESPLRMARLARMVPPAPQRRLQIDVVGEGWAAHYAPQIMEQVIRTRQQGTVDIPLPPFDPDNYMGFVARPDCAEVGQEIWLDFGQGWIGPFLVADCARVHDRPHIEGRGIIVELGYPSAAQFGVTATGGRRVRVGRAARAVACLEGS